MTPLMHDNVVMLNNNSIFQDITTFLISLNNGKAEKYERTAQEYERDFKRFFKVMLGKELNELIIEDLYFLPKDVKRFQNFMIGAGFKSSTANRNIASLKSLFSYFESNRYKFRDDEGELVYIKADQFDVDKIENNDAEGWGIFLDYEMKQLIELAKELKDGEEKSLCLELASVTSFRIEALMNLTWKDFRQEGSTWVASCIDKDKLHEKSVRTDLYERLLATKKDEKLFHVTVRTMERVLNTLVEKMGLDPDRNLTFHSIKKYGMMEVFNITNGNIIEVSTQGNHSSFETAMKYYLQFSKDYSKMPSLMIGQEVDAKPIEELSHEELLNLIKKSSRGLQYELLHTLKNGHA